MAKNRFEKVEEEQPDALNLIFRREGEYQIGRVKVPSAALSARISGEVDSGDIPAKDAFRGAVKLANEMKLAIVVIDPDNVWLDEWGRLWREA